VGGQKGMSMGKRETGGGKNRERSVVGLVREGRTSLSGKTPLRLEMKPVRSEARSIGAPEKALEGLILQTVVVFRGK